MRIRKRLLLSSLPLDQGPLSDLKHHRSEAAPPSNQPPHDPSKLPSDQSMAIRGLNLRWVSPKPDYNTHEENKMKQKEFGDDQTTRYDETSGNDIRKLLNISFGKGSVNHKIRQSSSTSAPEGNEDDKMIPLKKRKGSFERNPKESAKMKSKTNKKCGAVDDIKLDQETADSCKQEVDRMSSPSMRGAKKNIKMRGNVIKEGSRCSRVNGRGWRCCQPTLVGYSLCEHHLGNGRLRSVANTVRRSSGTATPSGDGGSGMLEPLIATKKRTKVGVVKARSMSSLLNQI